MRNTFNSLLQKKYFEKIEAETSNTEITKLIQQTLKSFLNFAIEELNFNAKSRNIQPKESNKSWRNLRDYFTRKIRVMKNLMMIRITGIKVMIQLTNCQ